jgi:hypothetical protein
MTDPRSGDSAWPAATPLCRQGLNYAIYHDRYARTGDGWKFTERVYEIRYLDNTPLAGSAPHLGGTPANPPDGSAAAEKRVLG